MPNSPRKRRADSTDEAKPHEPAKRQVRTGPSEPGFSVDEAKELIGMCVAANFLGPVVFPPFPMGLTASADPDDPLPNDDGKTYPYPETRIWPQGWGPGVPSKDPDNPWKRSILTSRLSNGTGINSAIFAFNAARNAYAVAFAGTLNPGAAMQNLAGLLIPAGPVFTDFFQSTETYLSNFPAAPVLPGGGQTYPPITEPPVQSARVHLGYRQAVESLTVGTQATPLNLRLILESIEADEIDLYVTGHSLGAAVAQLFSAWVRAGGVSSKKINVKCYSFATPKSCNTPMALNYALALGNDGFSYRVDNTLDTAQQLPPTTEKDYDLINPAIASDLQSKATPTGPYAASPLAPIINMILASGIPGGAPTPAAAPAAPTTPPPSTTAAPAGSTAGKPAEQIPFPLSIPLSIVGEIIKGLTTAKQASGQHAGKPGNGAPSSQQQPTEPLSMDFVAMGVPHVLRAVPPVIYNGKCYPPEFFPGRDETDLVEIPDTTTREWWQHWPYNYAKYLSEGEEL